MTESTAMVSIEMTKEEWQAIRYQLGTPDAIGVLGIDPEPYQCVQKLLKAIDQLEEPA